MRFWEKTLQLGVAIGLGEPATSGQSPKAKRKGCDSLLITLPDELRPISNGEEKVSRMNEVEFILISPLFFNVVNLEAAVSRYPADGQHLV